MRSLENIVEDRSRRDGKSQREEKRNDDHNTGGYCPDDPEFGSPQVYRMLGFPGLLDIIFVLVRLLRRLLVQLRRVFLQLQRAASVAPMFVVFVLVRLFRFQLRMFEL